MSCFNSNDPPDQLMLFSDLKAIPLSPRDRKTLPPRKVSVKNSKSSRENISDSDFDDKSSKTSEIEQSAEDHLVDAILEKVILPDQVFEEELERIFIGCISIFWDNVVATIGHRLKCYKSKMSKQDMLDYEATLGWLLGYWEGSIPLDLVLLYENNLQKNVDSENSYSNIKQILFSNLLIAEDCLQLKIKLCGGELFAKDSHA